MTEHLHRYDLPAHDLVPFAQPDGTSDCAICTTDSRAYLWGPDPARWPAEAKAKGPWPCPSCAHGVYADHGQATGEGCADCADCTLSAIDRKYHDHLPPGANCHLCGVEHSAINPQNLGRPRSEWI